VPVIIGDIRLCPKRILSPVSAVIPIVRITPFDFFARYHPPTPRINVLVYPPANCGMYLVIYCPTLSRTAPYAIDGRIQLSTLELPIYRRAAFLNPRNLDPRDRVFRLNTMCLFYLVKNSAAPTIKAGIKKLSPADCDCVCPVCVDCVGVVLCDGLVYCPG
jgi:hypothetical protein